MIKIRKMIKMTSEMSMASMSDIAFLLIIFFMVASVFIIKDGLHLVLPDKKRKPVLMASRDVIRITVFDKGRILYNDKQADARVLEEMLIEASRDNKKVFVLLEISRRVKYSNAITIIDIIKFSGIKRLSIKMI
jgi:biopolymer transport protein ExbD